MLSTPIYLIFFSLLRCLFLQLLKKVPVEHPKSIIFELFCKKKSLNLRYSSWVSKYNGTDLMICLSKYL